MTGGVRRRRLFRCSSILALVLCAVLVGCDDPSKRVVVGNKEYRSLPTRETVSWPSSGTTNGTGCMPPSGKSVYC